MNILITGAASGIGFDIAKKMSKDNHIYLTVHTEMEEKRLKLLNSQNKNMEIFKLDVTNKNDIKKIIDKDIDVFISNAAASEIGSLVDININKIRKTYEVNVFSNFELIQIILRKMIKKGHGKIIIISSILSQFIIPFFGPYASSKASISSLGLTLRKEINLLNKNIHISIIEPGCYHTGFNQQMMNSMYASMNEKSLFFYKKDKIYYRRGLFFKILEHKKLNSITNKVVKIIKCTKPKSLYKIPLDQGLFIKLYMLFRR